MGRWVGGHVGTVLASNRRREGSSEAGDLPVPIRSHNEKEQPNSSVNRLLGKYPGVCAHTGCWVPSSSPGAWVPGDLCPWFRPTLGIDGLSSVSPAFKLIEFLELVLVLFDLMPCAPRGHRRRVCHRVALAQLYPLTLPA